MIYSFSSRKNEYYKFTLEIEIHEKQFMEFLVNAIIEEKKTIQGLTLPPYYNEISKNHVTYLSQLNELLILIKHTQKSPTKPLKKIEKMLNQLKTFKSEELEEKIEGYNKHLRFFNHVAPNN